MSEKDPFTIAFELHRSGQLADAEQHYRIALESEPDSSFILVHLATVVQNLGRLGEAIELQRRALVARPDFVEAWCNLGNMLMSAGRGEEAAAAQHSALALRPGLVEAWVNLSAALRACGRTDEAITAARNACNLRPDFPEGWYQLGSALRQSGRFREAVEPLEQAVRLKPHLFPAWYELGGCLQEEGRFEAAGQALSQAVALRPDSAEAACALGNALCAMGQWAPAREQFERSLNLRPGLFEASIGVAAVLCGEGRPREAADAYLHCIESEPDNIQVRRGLAFALCDQGRFDDGMEIFERLGEQYPSDPTVQFELGCELLLRGDWSRGLRLYEKRLNVPRFAPLVPGAFSEWDGSELRDRRILLHHEQGFGDTIQFVRYLAMPSFRGKRIVLRCQKALHSLLNGQFDVEHLIADGEPLPEEIDCHCTLPSLPGKFTTDESTIPSTTPYIRAIPKLADTWRQKVGECMAALRVGIAWAGNPAFVREHRRRIDPELLFRMAAGFGAEVQWFSLQKSSGRMTAKPDEAGVTLVDFTSELTDFAQTAALMSQLDLILSVDTSIPHLAGALGIPVWLMLAFMPDWRWQLRRADSPWYPTMRVFRQPRLNDWPAVLEEVARSLREQLLHGRRSPDMQ